MKDKNRKHWIFIDTVQSVIAVIIIACIAAFMVGCYYFVWIMPVSLAAKLMMTFILTTVFGYVINLFIDRIKEDLTK